MTFILIFDENASHHVELGLMRAGARFTSLRVGDGTAPPVGSSDEVLLEFAETCGGFIVTNDRRTMSAHLRAHVARGGTRAGAFIVRRGTAMGRLVEELAAIVGASTPDEWRGTAVYLPL